MSNNRQRRETAKRKLERQLERRREQEKARRQRITIASVIAAVVAVVLVIWLLVDNKDDKDGTDTTAAAPSAPAAEETTQLTTSVDLPPGTCEYLPDGSTGGPNLPSNLRPATTGIVEATMTLSAGTVGLNLDRASAPCAVNSFINLAAQKYFDDTVCHRLTTTDTLKVLQCGDPTGTGAGGPGYSFADELDSIPTDGITYPTGTIAMANAGPDTNGSQFFLVYGDSPLPPSYTILGTMDEAGLDVVSGIGAKGTAGGGQDGAPADEVKVESITVPEGAAIAFDPTTDEAPAPTADPADADTTAAPTGTTADDPATTEVATTEDGETADASTETTITEPAQ